MRNPFAFEIEGDMRNLARRVQEEAKGIDTAARQAVNRTVDRVRTLASREIRRHVNFEAAYLDSSEGKSKRLGVTKRATSTSLEAVVTARHRATSLARFTDTTVSGLAARTGGVRVEVKPGTSKIMKRAFLMRLRRGKSDVTDTRFNLGLAIRLKPGERIENKLKMQTLSKNLYLLYGPSVDQVFRSVAPEISPEAVGLLEQEFIRLLEVHRGK